MRPRVRDGFVLLEAVVALAIIGLVSVALLQARGQQIRVAGQAKELLTEQALAEDRLAALALLDYEDLARPDDSILSGVFPPPFEAFSWVTNLEEVEDEYDLFSVEVIVTGPDELFPLSTLIHRSRPVLGAGGGGGQGGQDLIGGGGGRGGRGGIGGGGRGGRGGAVGRGGGGGGRGGRGGFGGGGVGRGGGDGADRAGGGGGRGAGGGRGGLGGRGGGG